ncbi:glycosyltransferase family 2 protein [Rhodovulum marinum]|uniref:Glycosyltransferase n=1 Tax=Rhodovulum marinum TaxID=320662 RepID=A0A4R2PYD8_9RHOB|nr:glycosyltransferase family 2 protein [Rhodovulum marinum]TCP39285.1 glycosyltransferase [Rhodovulum marinum]
MKISVVTAVFDRSGTIGDALRSVAGQSHGDVEHVIQDGGSTDGTLERIAALATGATRLETGPDAGIYDAINRGIARATGDVIGLMHSDDFFAHDRVLERVAAALADPGIDGVYGDLDYVSAADPQRVIRHWKSGGYDRAKLARGWMPPHPTLYLRREVFAAWGAYDTRFRISADYDAMLRWLVRGNIRLAYIPEVLVKMRVGGASNGSLGRILRKSREDLHALRRNEVGGVGALALKNAQKLSQFVIRERRARA